MTKTHYLGFTKSGEPIGRASQNDYGFTHAAVKSKDGKRVDRLPSFSTSAAGAARNAGDYFDHEIVTVQIVDAKTYREAFKK